jgi:anti-repressor protein
VNGFFDHIKHTRSFDGKAYWVVEEVFDDLGVTNKTIQDRIIEKTPKWLIDNGIASGKIFKDLDDWMVTEMGLYGIIGCTLVFHGNKARIHAAKVAFGMMLPPTTETALPVPITPEPAVVIHTPAQPVQPEPVSALPQVFSYEDRPVRTAVIDGEVWLVVKDICDVLGFRMASDATCTLDDDEKGTHIVRTLGGTQEMLCINEPGLYSLILRSRKPEAKAFKRWVTHEVIPTIRKTGSYSVQPAQPVRALPTDYKSALVQLLDEVSKNEVLEAKVVQLEPKAQFHDAVTDATNCHTFIEVAKILGTGQNRLYAWCRENGFLMKGNMPYQRYIDSGHFKLIETPYEDPKNGETRLSYKTLITGKGLALIQRRWSEGEKKAA